LDGQTRDTTKNTRISWREIGGNRRENDWEGRKQEKKKNQGLEGRQKKTMMK